MKLIYLKEARRDQREAVIWYRNESQKAAEGFLLERAELLGRIKASPQQTPFFDHQYQIALMHRYPYRIIFRADDDHILIVAVAHTSRAPHYWAGRE